MKVLHTISGIWKHTGGPAESVPSLCAGLLSFNNEIEIATLSGPLSLSANSSITKGVVISQYKHYRGFSLSIGVGIYKALRRVDLIHNHGLWEATNWFSGFLSILFKKPFVVSPRGSLEPLRLKHSKWRKKIVTALLDQWCLKYASCIHACSITEYESIRAYGLRNPIAIIPNAVSFKISKEHKDLYRRQFFSKYSDLKGKKILLFMSRISWEKGIPLLAEVISCQGDEFKNWHLVIAGSGDTDYVRSMKNKFQNEGIVSNVSWVGIVQGEQKNELLSAANLFILPSHSENFGISIAEALSVGIPVITTNGTPWKEINDFKCGWWVECSKNALAIALNEAIKSSDERLQILGENGINLIKSKYSWENISHSMNDVYQWLVFDGPKPDCVREL
jgi:glycosyltransferase involved in cell wall biosynthesis